MTQRLSYGLSLLATVVAGILSGVVMVIPSWLWSRYVLHVSFDAIVGRGEGLSTADRILLYGGDLVLAFLGYVVYAWMTRSLYSVFQNVELSFWDTFAALLATGILAAIVGFFLPFVGILIAVFVAPVFVNGVMRAAEGGPLRGR